MITPTKRRLDQYRNTLLLNGGRKRKESKPSWLNQTSLLVVAQCEKTLTSWRNRIQRLKSRPGRLRLNSPRLAETRTLTPLPKAKKKTVLIIRPLHRLSTSSVPDAKLEQAYNPKLLPSPMCELVSHPYPESDSNERSVTRTPGSLNPVHRENLRENVRPFRLLRSSPHRKRVSEYSCYHPLAPAHSPVAPPSQSQLQPQPQPQTQLQLQLRYQLQMRMHMQIPRRGDGQRETTDSRRRRTSETQKRLQTQTQGIKATPTDSELAFLASIQDENGRRGGRSGLTQLGLSRKRGKPNLSDLQLCQTLPNSRLLPSRHAITPDSIRGRADRHPNLLRTQAKLTAGLTDPQEPFQRSMFSLTTMVPQRPKMAVGRNCHYSRTISKKPMHVHSSTYANHMRNNTIVVDNMSRTQTQLENDISLVAQGNKCIREACRDNKLSVLHNPYYLST
jgi:hypothetical protein